MSREAGRLREFFPPGPPAEGAQAGPRPGEWSISRPWNPLRRKHELGMTSEMPAANSTHAGFAEATMNISPQE